MSDTVFYNMWHTTSPENKAKCSQRCETRHPLLPQRVGFRSMTVLEGDDDRVLVEGRWASREAFDAAVTSDESARLSRQALEAFGRPEPGVFGQDIRVGPMETDDPDTCFWHGAVDGGNFRHADHVRVAFNLLLRHDFWDA